MLLLSLRSWYSIRDKTIYSLDQIQNCQCPTIPICQVTAGDGSEKSTSNESYSSRFEEAANKIKQIPA